MTAAERLELVRAGRTPDELAQEFEPSAQTIRNWLAQAERDAGQRTDGLLEREILAKATAWFARETGTIPSSGSGS